MFVVVLRAEALERLTVRRLAAELDTGAASLYVCVQSTAELHAAVLDELLGAVTVPPGQGSGTWSADVTRLLWSYTTILLEYCTLARSVLVLRPSGPNYLALAEHLLSLLRAGGVPEGQSAWGISLLLPRPRVRPCRSASPSSAPALASASGSSGSCRRRPHPRTRKPH